MEQLRKLGDEYHTEEKSSRTFRNQGCPRQAGGLFRIPSNLYTGKEGPGKARGTQLGPRQSLSLTLLQFDSVSTVVVEHQL